VNKLFLCAVSNIVLGKKLNIDTVYAGTNLENVMNKNTMHVKGRKTFV
jgi:hypothetical protein